MNQWMLTLPQEGAARHYALAMLAPLQELLGSECVHVFDFKQWHDLVGQSLKLSAAEFESDFVGQAFINQCVDKQITHLLSTALSPINAYYLIQAKKLKIRRIHWFYEDWRIATYWQDVAVHYDLFCHIQPGEFDRVLNSMGVQTRYLENAAMYPRYPYPQQKNIKFGFVGVPTAYRQQVFTQLLDLGIRVHVLGPGWSAVNYPAELIVGNQWATASVPHFLSRCQIGIDIPAVDPGLRINADIQLSPRIYDYLLNGLEVITYKSDCLEESSVMHKVHAYRNIHELVDYCSRPGLNLRNHILNHEVMYYSILERLRMLLGFLR